MTRALLEIIALDALDASAAEAGGADRLELVSDMRADGLTPTVETVAAVRAATSLPLRVMLRSRAGFQTDERDLDELTAVAGQLIDAGADGFVLGFLTGTGEIDAPATTRLAGALRGRPWTFHRAIDHAVGPDAWEVVCALPGLDAVLTAGSPDGLGVGLDTLLARDPALILAGGGLTAAHVPVLRDRGVRAFHVGSAARGDGGWEAAVSAERVAEWRAVVSG
ncbi:copper homeostasis protein CutC [Longispora fulva]|uniref:Copper homeostasis protein cutC homolog n=1 Tax=Longispora fulva TaxID=619741 RepID=A0A8J7GJ80_9ACTN|nr:copper homeostasis protein CutC [Longispora fulva]MBG6139121.1 copper homeostasis protein [Longispora fulva]GIG58613.1 copper homeostasis protein CutC [Longispora fulva]